METKNSDEILERFCESCFKDGFENVPAEGFCGSCVTFFCKTCLKYHARFLPDHFQQNQKDMPNDFCRQNCKTHQNEIVKFYCQACECFVCSTCKLDSHRDCGSVQYVPALLKVFEDEKVYESLTKKFDTLEEKLDQTKVLIEKGYGHVKQSKEKTQSEVREYKDKISKLFERLKEDIDKVSSEGMQRFKDKLAQLSELKSKFKGVRSKLQRIQRTDQRCDLFMGVKESEKVVQSIDEQIESLKAEIELHIEDFNTEIINKSTDDLGILNKVRHEKNVETQRHDANDEKHMKCITGFWLLGIVMVIIPVLAAMTCFHLLHGGTQYENEFIFEESYKGRDITREEPITISTADISIKIKSTPVLHELCILNKNYLTALDIANRLLLLLSSVEKTIISHYQYQDQPWDIAKVSETEVAVIFDKSSEIHLMKINYMNSSETIIWSVVKIFKTEMKFFFPLIAYRNEMLFIASGNEITQFDMDGNKKRTLFQTNIDDISFRYLTVKTITESIHIISYPRTNSMKIVRVTSEKVHGTIYIYDDLKAPAGMAVDGSGNIYVCGFLSHNIHVLTDNLTKGEVLLDEKDGIKNPVAIAVSDEDKKIFISSLHSDVISVYRFV